VLKRLGDKSTSTIAGVVLFSLAYLVGASVARVADDFFNDDDLGIKISEDDIRAAVYCSTLDPKDPDRWLVQNGVRLIDRDIHSIDSKTLCADPNTWKNNVRQTYSVQEASLLLNSAGNTDRLRYLHQQHVVLRGVAFDGLISTLLCLFGACTKHRPRGQYVQMALSAVILGWAIYATVQHFSKHPQLASEPPLMEITLILLAVAGLCLAWRDVPQRPYECGFMFSFVLTGLAFSGWWYSEILYDHTVIYFFYAHTHQASILVP
jgi:hypothetical protein